MLLALDTSTAQIGLALFDGSQVIGEFIWRGRGHHTVELAPALLGLFHSTGIKMDEVRILGVALGPGSFTSLRVGLSMAKGMALARHLPLIGIPSLDVVAAAQPLRRLPLAAVLQAGRGRLAVGRYRVSKKRWQAEGSLQVMDIDKLARIIQSPTIVCGELTLEERQRLARKHRNIILPSPVESLRRPSVLAGLAWERWQSNRVDSLASLGPIYLSAAGGIPV